MDPLTPLQIAQAQLAGLQGQLAVTANNYALVTDRLNKAITAKEAEITKLQEVPS